MKKIIVALALFMAGFSAEAQLKTPQSSPKTTIVQSVGLTDVEINYSISIISVSAFRRLSS